MSGKRTRAGRPVLVAVLCLVLGAALAGCTGSGGSGHHHAPTPTGPGRSTGSAQTLAARPVPLHARITRVSGPLRKRLRTPLTRKVRHTVASYVDAAFLRGDYPRHDFSKAFASFTPGAARKARHDRRLLTNAGLGSSVVSITPRRNKAWLSVLAPHKVPAGVTARIRLVFEANRTTRPDKRVEMTGRLLLTRGGSGGWKIFGYDVARSVTPAGGGAGTRAGG